MFPQSELQGNFTGSSCDRVNQFFLVLLTVVSPYKLGVLKNLLRRPHITIVSAVSEVTDLRQNTPTAAKNKGSTMKEARIVAAFLFAMFL